ncbi:FtsX-like permease family protein [Bacteroidota bacterium]
MLRNYFKIAFRNIIKNKIYVLINILGMGVAISFCLTIYLIFAYNNEFDNYYSNTSDIYRIHEFKQHASGEIQRFELAPTPMGPRLPNEVAGVKEQTRYTHWYENIKLGDEIFSEAIAYVDTTFFDLFEIQLTSGTHSSINEKKSIFLARELEKKLFNDESGFGKILSIHYPGKKVIDYTVAGVFKQIPFNSSFTFGAMTQIDNFLDGHKIEHDDWTAWQQTSSYVRLEENANAGEVEINLQPYITIQNEAREEWKVSDFELVEFKDASKVNQSVVAGSNSNYRLRNEVIIIFGAMALLILFIASFNLANTSISLMARRIKEIGVRKVMGGGTSQIFTQFMMEMALTSMFALLFGLALFGYISDAFFALWDAPIEMADFSVVNLGISIAILFILATFMAGLYPALYSNKFQPAIIFRRQIKLRSSGIVSKILNGLQFAFSIVVLIAGIVFTQNAEFLKMLDYGYDQEGLIVTYVEDGEEYRQLRDKVESYSGVSGLSGTGNHFGYSYEDTFLKLDTGFVEIRSLNVGDNYLNLMDLDLIDGRFFDKNSESDYSEGVIVNEEYVDRFQLENPIGKLVNLEEGKKYIVGVVGNIIDQVWSDNKIIPKVYLPAKEENYTMLLVKADLNKQEDVFDYIKASWNDLFPDRPFTGRYQDDVAFGNALSENNNMKKIFFALALIGSLLSLTGIFALSSLNVSSRFKEIGIRKVMGATSGNILTQLNKDFLGVMVIATIAGSGLGYFLTNQILAVMYTYHISIGIVTLLLSGSAILFVAIMTTTWTIITAANTNPAYILRDE